MLAELHARDLGVIADLTLTLAPGLTAVTGETGAGKTLVVEAIALLVGEKADPVLVRPGADEARVEGRFFLDDGSERVVARVVPRVGRSRAYVDGRLASVGELAELGRQLVDLHGQHAHQSLLGARVQREALDRFGPVDLGPLQEVQRRVGAVEAALAAMGGDERARAREADLLRYQIAEIEAARIDGGDEEERLEAEEDVLADASAHREAGSTAYEALAADDGAADWLGRAVAACGGRRPFHDLEARLRGMAAEVGEAAADLRRATEAITVDPDRLDQVGARRRLLADLRRKYGERLSDVLDFEIQTRARLAELEQHGERARVLEQERAQVGRQVAQAAAVIAAARREAAPRLAAAVEGRLQSLAMAGARFEVAVDGPDPADDITFLLGANRGEATLPLAKVASGGELARAMLAMRLVLGGGTSAGVTAGGGPTTLVFDEVDAGIGGQAALAVGAALADLAGGAAGAGPGADVTGEGFAGGSSEARPGAVATPAEGSSGAVPHGEHSGRQVLVVTHLPQVAAFADHQVAVTKSERGGRTVAEATMLSDEERVVELSRMLSGQPSSATARDHAQELLASATRQKAGSG